MKIIGTAAMVLGLLVVASLGDTVRADESDARHMMAKAVAAWNAHDPQELLDLMADDFVYYSPGAGGKVTSKDVLRNFYQSYMDFSSDFKWTVAGETVVSADSVAFDWHYGGTSTGPLGDKPATGKKWDIYGASLIRFKDGKITFQGNYWDLADFQKQLAVKE